MSEFPIDEIYRRMAKFDSIREDLYITVGSGTGFFYWYNDEVSFVTSRRHVIVEEKAYLPDSIMIYLDTEPTNLHRDVITVPLYDKTEKPIWQVLETNSEQIFVSIPIPKSAISQDYTHCFIAVSRFPSVVSLPVDDIILNIPIPVCVSLAGYFYSDIQDCKALQKTIEKQGEFKINRRGFATDMIEMILVLLQHNLDRLKKLEGKNNFTLGKRKDEMAILLAIRDNLILELKKITVQFRDVLEPSVFERIQSIFSILKDSNLEDYLIVRHLIQKVLSVLGQNIIFTQ
jgi:hypothetical protein